MKWATILEPCPVRSARLRSSPKNRCNKASRPRGRRHSRGRETRKEGADTFPDNGEFLCDRFDLFGRIGMVHLVVLVGRRIRGNRTAGGHLEDRIGGDCAWALRRSVAARRFEFGSRDTRTQVWGIVSIGGAFHFRIKELKAIWFCMPQASGLPCHAPAACTPSLTETT